MASKLTRFRVVNVGSTAIPAKDVSLNPLNVDFIEDSNFTGYMDASAGRAAARWAEPAFTVELCGRAQSQALTDTLSVDAFFKAAGFTGAAGASNYVYTLSDTPNASMTAVSAMQIEYHTEVSSGTNALLYKFTNLAADATFKFVAGQIAEVDWSFLGKFVINPKLGTVASSIATQGNPLRCIKGTLSTTIGGVSKTLTLNSLTLALGNNMVLPDSIVESYGKAAGEITGRSTTIEMVVIEPDQATLDFWYAMQESGLIDQIAQPINFSLLLGTTAKNKITVAGGGYMLGFPERVDIDGISYYTIRLKYDQSNWHTVPTQITFTCT